ncbi:MAG: 6-bladed beta-propeller, partial [Gemmatimonadales bacterium]
MIQLRQLLRALLVVPVGAAPACGDGASGGTAGPTSAPLWQLSADPLLEIGVVEGNPNYELSQVSSSLRLGDGRFVVVNAGSQQLLFFDSQGRFLNKAGGRGGGPGEFRHILRVHQYGDDSLRAYFPSGNRIAVFDDHGNYARTEPIDSTLDAEFPMDVWLYRRFWIDGAWEREARLLAKRALDRMPVPSGDPAYRFVLALSRGEIWVREPIGPTSTGTLWTVFDSTGSAIGMLEAPLRFDVHQIGSGFVLGRWLGENDVNFVRLYRLRRSGPPSPLPRWVVGEGGPASAPSMTQEERNRLIAEMGSALRWLIVAQERFFADNMTYAGARHELEWEG